MPTKKYSKSIKVEGGDYHVFFENPFDIINETPLDNRIIVKEDKQPTKTAGGIILPNTDTKKPYTGITLAVGTLCEKIKLHDRVRYAQRAGDKIEIEGVEYLMLRETDCYTILNK